MDFRELRKRAKARKQAEEEAPDGAATEPEAAAGNDAADAEPSELESAMQAVAADLADTAEEPGAEDAGEAETAEEEPDEEWDEEFEAEFEETVEILRLRLNQEFFALYLEEIEEIIKPKAFTWVPRTPAWILGIVSLRGTMVPVVDLRRRLGVPAGDDGSQRIVVITYNDELCGLLVDEVRNVEAILPDRIEPLPAALTETAGRFLSGLVRIDKDLIALIDLEAVLNSEGIGGERAA